MKKIRIFVVLALSILMSYNLAAANYRLLLNWDEFEGECNGFISCNIDNEIIFLNGARKESKLDDKIISLGEGYSSEAKQEFLINSDEGIFTFWIKDKFADDDINADPTLIAKAQPIISVYKNDELIELIKIPKGAGLACKVFTLYAEDSTIDREIRYFPKSRIIIGRIVNAVSGKPLEEVQISITDYMKQTTKLTTDKTGVFIFDAEVAEYKISMSKNGFIPTEFEVRMGADEMPREIICAMSPEIKQFRIVLTWGSRPKDLDAHLSGPRPNGEKFHIWYRNQYPIGGKDFLDIDDVNKYGPETITIYKPAVGEYFYSVFDYSNRMIKTSRKLSLSNARVQVYGKNKLLSSFVIPSNKKGNCWHVFTIDENQKIVPVNKIDFVKNEKDIR